MPFLVVAGADATTPLFYSLFGGWEESARGKEEGRAKGFWQYVGKAFGIIANIWAITQGTRRVKR